MSVAAKLTADPPSAKDNRMGSFIVEFWSRVFQLPQYISPFWWIKQLFPRVSDSYRFVDAWVLGRFFGAILLYVATATAPLQWLESIGVAYGGLMVLEALFYEADLLVFHSYRSAKKGELHSVLSYRRLVITSLQNYCAIIFWFALFYRHWDAWFAVEGSHDVDRVVTWLALSFKTMTGLGHISVEASNLWGNILLLTQAAIGVSMALLIVVSFVRLLPKPGTKDYWESSRPPLDEPSLAKLANMGRDGKMPRKNEPLCAPDDMLRALVTGTIALGLWRATEPAEVPDKQRSYALAAIVGPLATGALCLGFAYQLSSMAADASTANRFFWLGAALVGIGVGLAVYSFVRHGPSST